ncbi:8-oxo-dGTP diphosphatase [Bradyrhizobium sp. AZCC 1578]|uniref:NUDIX hydrolase n=1 Tax=Bradyrhizobium sp. AZCC 1578 TaxID=3117027 RepID=UPI002FF0F4E3
MQNPTREIAAAILIDTDGRLLLQRRDDKPDILQPGKVGMFGGHREGDETFIDCVVREVAEEISCRVPVERFQHLLSLDGPDPDGSEGCVKGELFIAYDIPTEELIITEGELLVVGPDDISKLRSELTPLTVIALYAFRKEAAN